MMRLTTKTTVTLTTQELITALETGALTGRTILDAEWTYQHVVDDWGRGNASYVRVVSGVTLTVQS
jgi:hypothetical protein